MDPFRGTRSVVGTEAKPRDPGKAFLARMRRLGATDDEITEMADRLDVFDDDWTPDVQTALLAKRDRELRDAIRWMHEADEHGTTTEEEAEAKAAFEAPMMVAQPIRRVLDWVYGDPIRARAAITAEQGQDKPRVTLLEELQRIADGPGS